MADISRVNPQVIDVINTVQRATMDPSVVKTSGAGKAYQSVSQSAAIAVQDATDSLRNMSAIAATAVGVAMAQFLATGEDKYAKAIEQAQKVMQGATDDFQKIGQSAADILDRFPSG
jgi:uncharacterized protein YoxC